MGNNNNGGQTLKFIYSPQLANWLVNHGYTVVDLKPNKQTAGTIFVFRVEKGFGSCIREWTSQEVIDEYEDD